MMIGSGSSEGSTSVRFRALRAAFRVLSAAAPELAARLAGALFRTPPRRREFPMERAILATGQRVALAVSGRPVAVWRWGDGPAVLLVHGWGSRGARLASFIEPLLARGFSVVTFDAPGHGESAGKLSSLPQFVEAIHEIARRLGPPAAVVAHSLGGAASAIAMARGLAPKAVVLLAPAANPADWTGRFASFLGVSQEVIGRMKRRFERQFGYRWEDFDVPRAAAGLDAPLLVFHDQDDPEVPWSDGAAIVSSWPGAEMVTTRDLGHKRIVHDPEVVASAVQFLEEWALGKALSRRNWAQR